METLDTKDIQNIAIEELSIDEARAEIDRQDAIILEAVQRRTAISKKIGETRIANGGTRLVHSREVAILDRYAELGPEGKNLALVVLKLGRGALGRQSQK